MEALIKSDAGAKLGSRHRYSRTHRQYPKYDNRSGDFLSPGILGVYSWGGFATGPSGVCARHGLFMPSFALAQPLEIATTT